MSAQPLVRRAAIPAPRQTTKQGPNVTLPRFVFSPALYCDLRFDMAAVNAIEPGVITFIGEKRYQVRNSERVTDPEGNHPEFAEKVRQPGIIAAQLTRIYAGDPNVGDVPTGFCLLDELTGLNPEENPADGDLINDLQETLLPRVFESGREQWEWLMSEDLEQICRAKDAGHPVKYYERTRQRLITATQQSIDYAENHVDDLAAQMADRGKGGPDAVGKRKQVFAHDIRLCAWAEREVPRVSSQLVKKDGGQALDVQELLQGLTSAVMAGNEQVLKGMAQILADTKKPAQYGPRIGRGVDRGNTRRDEGGDSTETPVPETGSAE